MEHSDAAQARITDEDVKDTISKLQTALASISLRGPPIEANFADLTKLIYQQMLYGQYRECMQIIAIIEQYHMDMSTLQHFKQVAAMCKEKLQASGCNADEIYYEETGKRPETIIGSGSTASTN